MKMKSVRSYLKKKTVGVFETRTSDSDIIIDGNYFKSTYKSSGCQFIIGGEYDRYANYLRKMLKAFTDKNIEVYVIFGGGMNANLEKRKEIHQDIIDRTDSVQPDQENEYCEPTFTKDVQKEVFEKLGIRYFVCDYDHSEALISLAIDYDIPVLTNNFEYCLFGVTCILPNSVLFEVDNGFRCTVYKPNRKLFPFSNDIMSILLAISDEDSSYYQHLPRILKCHEKTIFVSAQHWIRKQNSKSAIVDLTKYLQPSDKQALLDTIANMQKLFKRSHRLVASSYRNRHAVHTKIIDTSNEGWFDNAIATGLIAVPYINLRNNKTFSGSWLIVDKNRDDAMLAALDIVFYAQGLLINSQDLKISFIGRKFSSSVVWEIEKSLPSRKALDIFRSTGKKRNSVDLFRVIIGELLKGFDFATLENISTDCHMIIIALVYYCLRKKDFQKGVYSILLSYFFLGPISKEVGVLKKSNFAVTHNADDKDYVSAANAFMDFFYLDESRLKTIFCRNMLHSIAEFEHCLQHVNFLNKLCGEVTMCTIYHKAINSTFIYNLYFTLTQEDCPLEYIKKRINNASVFSEYGVLINVFETCLHSVMVA